MCIYVLVQFKFLLNFIKVSFGILGCEQPIDVFDAVVFGGFF